MARIEAGKTLRQTEEETGVTKDTISRIERGLREPQALTVARLAKAYGRPTEELFPPKAPAPPSPEPTFNDVLGEERRSIALIKVLRAHFWDLRLRWKEPGNKPSPGQIRDALDLLQRLGESGALDGTRTTGEQAEMQLLFKAAEKLRPIAEEFAAAEDAAEEIPQQQIEEAFSKIDA